MRTVTKLVAAVGLALVPALLVAPASHATGNKDNVCVGLMSGKKDVDGDKKTITIEAPEGALIDRFCVKAGSVHQGGDNGPQYFDVEPPKATVTITHPTGKDISHYSFSWVLATEPTTEPSGQPSSPPTTEPTSPPTSEPSSPPTDEPTTEPTDEPTTEPTDEPTTEPTEPTSPTQSVDSETATPPPADDSDDDKGVGGSDSEAPTAVDAGLVGNTSSTSTTSIATLVGLVGGALLLASAFLMRMRKRGDHRA